MAERDKAQPESAEQLGQQLLELVDKTEFGTAQFRAVSDSFDLQTLYGNREWKINSLVGEGRDKVERESDIRMYEMKIALLEHQIEQNKSQIPGYSGAYHHFETLLESINSVARVEAEKKFTDIKEQELYVRRMWEVAYNGAHEIISMKKDTS